MGNIIAEGGSPAFEENPVIVRCLSTRSLLDRMYEIECLVDDTGKLINAGITTLADQQQQLTDWWREYSQIVGALRCRGAL